MAIRRRLLWSGTAVVGVGVALLCGAVVATADTGTKTHGNGASSTSGTTPSQGKSPSGGPSQGKSPSGEAAARNTLSAPPLPRSHNGIGTDNGLAVTVGKQSDFPVAHMVPLSLPQPVVSTVTVRVPVPMVEPHDWKPRVVGLQTAAAPVTGWAQPTIAVEPAAVMLPSPPLADAIARAPRLPNLATGVVLGVLSALGWSPRRETPGTFVTRAVGAAAQVVSERLSADPPLPTSTTKTALTDPAAPSLRPDPLVPGVEVGHSRLTITSAGKAVVVPADWYVPTGSTPPQGLIYLQNGWLAGKVDYSLLAARLAEQTDSIVVVPTVASSNLACPDCWLGSDQMAQGVANLFAPGNDALSASAAAAGYQGTLPQDVVLAGHSAGGGLVVDAAGYMEEDGIGDLKGVVLFDADPFINMGPALAEIPDTVPVYQIASPPSFWNTYGNGTAQLLQARPDQFDGVMVVGGKHIDSMQSSNLLVDLVLQLADGPSLPKNRQAVDTLAVGWIDDMYSGTHVQGVYGTAGQKIPVGRATVVVLPTPNTPFTPIIELLRGILDFVEG